MTMGDTVKPEVHLVEEAVTGTADGDEITMSPAKRTVGTVQLLVKNETVLIPTPSPDPKGEFALVAERAITDDYLRSSQSTDMEKVGNSASCERLRLHGSPLV